MYGTCIEIKLNPLLCRILSLLNDALPVCYLTDSYSYLLRAVCTCRSSYSEYSMQTDKGISWMVFTAESSGLLSGNMTWRRRHAMDAQLLLFMK